MRHRGTVLAVAASAVVVMMIAPASASEHPPWPLAVALQGQNGVVRATEPGLSCADDGEGSYRHYFVDAPLAGGVMSKLTGKARATMDLHYDGDKALAARGPNAFLLGTESHLTLSNERGSVQVALPPGSCAAPALSFDGTTASGTGAWTNPAGTGAYRGVTGSGTFNFSAEMNPGADNAWRLNLSGLIEVLQPNLTVRVERTYWGNLGLDYVTRVVTVVYRIANTGPGDSFGARFKSAASNTSGVRACGEPQSLLDSCPSSAPPERALGDLSSCTPPDGSLPSTCDTELVTVRYRIEPLAPCENSDTLLGCDFETEVKVDMPDALDVTASKSAAARARTPEFPPSL